MPSKSPSEYTQAEVNVWLNSIGLGSKVDVFNENGVDGQLLVTLSEADLSEIFGFSVLQARKFALSLDFANSLAEGGDGANSQQSEALQRENAQLKEEIANLRAINKELQDQLMPPAPAPAPPPQQYRAPEPAPPPQQYYAPAPAPRPVGAPVLVGAGGGALVSHWRT
jgi:cell division protein FtsB